jgi:uncharacterized DUF497 family protein
MHFEWDEGKNEVNQKIHNGISFELASRVFQDNLCVIHLDRIDEETGETRWHALGRAAGLSVYLVVHTERKQENGKKITRIISARKADKSELRRYLEQATD